MSDSTWPAYLVIRPRNLIPREWVVQCYAGGKTSILARVPSKEEALTVAEGADLPLFDLFECVICGEGGCEHFMVRGGVWREAGLGPGSAHLACIEERIGRRLTAGDFDLATPINALIAFGMRLERGSVKAASKKDD